MKLSKLAAIALAALLVTAGAAAATPGNGPDHAGADEHEQASDNQPDDADDEQEDDAAAADENATSGAENADEHAAAMGANGAVESNQRADQAQGPPSDMPEQVPDHVMEIHRLIADFLMGDLDGNLGVSVSDVTPDENNEDTTADATG